MSWFDSIYADNTLSHRAKVVYMYLRDRANPAGACWPGINTIAAELRLSRSTVKRALSELEQRRCIQKEPRYRENGSHSSNLYTLK